MLQIEFSGGSEEPEHYVDGIVIVGHGDAFVDAADFEILNATLGVGYDGDTDSGA